MDGMYISGNHTLEEEEVDPRTYSLALALK